MLTVTKSVTCEPSARRHDIVNVVAVVIGTVDPPPFSVLWEKLPSGEVSVHETTPSAFQKIDAREPSETDAGTAQISIFVGATGACAAGVCVAFVGCCVSWTCGFVADGVAAGVVFTVPTWWPRHEQSESKNDDGMTYERKLEFHGREAQSLATVP